MKYIYKLRECRETYYHNKINYKQIITRTNPDTKEEMVYARDLSEGNEWIKRCPETLTRGQKGAYEIVKELTEDELFAELL